VNTPDYGERLDIPGELLQLRGSDAWTDMIRTSLIKPGSSPAQVPVTVSGQMRSRWWLRIGLILLIYTLIGMLEAGQNLMMQYLSNRPPSTWKALLVGISDWYIWAALTPFVLLVVHYCPFGQRSWPVSLFLHIVLSVMCASLVIQLMIPVLVSVQLDLDWTRRYNVSDSHEVGARLLGLRFAVYLIVYWTIVGVGHALAYYRKYREREMQAILLGSRLAQAQLQMLKLQLQPHFLFNTLNAISALMHQDVELADQMLAHLAQLLRTTLESGGTQEVPLKHELEFVELYLEIEQARFGPRLVVKMDASADTMDASVPNLILQPLVENAIRHGIAPRPETGHIEIRARRSNCQLRVEIMDDGPGLPSDPSTPVREGVGLANTRARLRQMYGDAHQFILANRSDGGLVVTVSIPFREIPDEPAPNEPEIFLPRPRSSSKSIAAPNPI
jgi:two-component sensor histidine kinase